MTFYQKFRGGNTAELLFLTVCFALTKVPENAILTTHMFLYCGVFVASDTQRGGHTGLKLKTLRRLASFLLLCAFLCCFFPQSASALSVPEFFQPEERESLSPEEREANLVRITAFLRDELDLPDSAVAAILANMDRESGFDPRAIDDTGNFFGLCQWSRRRWVNCFNFCRENELDRFSVEGQLAFLRYELNGEFEWIYLYYLLPAEDSEDGAQEAQYEFCASFEAPLDVDWEQVARSKLVAEVYWPMLTEGSLAWTEPELPEESEPALRLLERATH